MKKESLDFYLSKKEQTIIVKIGSFFLSKVHFEKALQRRKSSVKKLWRNENKIDNGKRNGKNITENKEKGKGKEEIFFNL